VDANKINADEVCGELKPRWVCGDSVNIQELATGEYDFLFTCPPYGDLEVYSDYPADISNMSADDFDTAYRQILANAVAMLKQDRFATIVVGNYRDKKGMLRDLVGLTVSAMEAAGARYYNDFVFVTPTGSLPMRAGKSFQASRKMGRTHQYVLNFVKGDPKAATLRLGDVDLPDMAQYATEEE
jgi:DNA modification methylase